MIEASFVLTWNLQFCDVFQDSRACTRPSADVASSESQNTMMRVLSATRQVFDPRAFMWMAEIHKFFVSGFQWRREKEVSVYFCSAKWEGIGGRERLFRRLLEMGLWCPGVNNTPGSFFSLSVGLAMPREELCAELCERMGLLIPERGWDRVRIHWFMYYKYGKPGLSHGILIL